MKIVGKNGPSTVIRIVVVAVRVSGVIIVATIILYFCKRRRRSTSVPTKQDVKNLLLQHGSQAPKRYRYSKIKKITKSFSDKLGKGGYGSVYKGKLSDGSLVDVKVLVEMDSNGEEFINEVASISKTCHVNIVNLLGFCYEGNKRALVYEYMPNMSLDKFINNSGSADNADHYLDLEQLYKIVVGIAKGLNFVSRVCSIL